MKKLMLLGMFLCITSISLAQSKSVTSLYDKYKKEKDFFHMDLAGNFLNFAKGWNIQLDEANLDAITESIERVRLFKLPVKGEQAKADFRNLANGLKKENFELMMEANDKGSGISVFSNGKRHMREIVLMINSTGEGDYMVVSLEGEFDAKELAKWGKSGKN